MCQDRHWLHWQHPWLESVKNCHNLWQSMRVVTSELFERKIQLSKSKIGTVDIQQLWSVNSHLILKSRHCTPDWKTSQGFLVHAGNLSLSHFSMAVSVSKRLWFLNEEKFHRRISIAFVDEKLLKTWHLKKLQAHWHVRKLWTNIWTAETLSHVLSNAHLYSLL